MVIYGFSYSVNKEDMWISRIPVPVEINASAHADDDFSKFGSIAELTNWNIYSPVWAPVSLEGAWLKLQDKDPFDYAKVERKIPASKELKVSFVCWQNRMIKVDFKLTSWMGTALPVRDWNSLRTVFSV